MCVCVCVCVRVCVCACVSPMRFQPLGIQYIDFPLRGFL